MKKYVAYPKYEYVKYSDAEKSRNSDNSHCSGTKRLFTWLLIFRHEERERQFLLCWLFLHRPQPTPSWIARPRVKISTHFWTARPRVKISTHFWTARPRVKISTHFWTAWPRVKISTNWPNKRAAHHVDHSFTGLAQHQITTKKSPKFPAHHFRAWRH